MSGVRTTYLGQFTWEHANSIAGELEHAGIAWWHKQGGRLAQIFFAEWGVRLFVDRARLDEARAIAARVLQGPGGDRRTDPGDA